MNRPSPAQDTINYISSKVKVWVLDKTFDNELSAKHHAAIRFIAMSGVMVAPYAGGTFSVFVWTYKDELAF